MWRVALRKEDGEVVLELPAALVASLDLRDGDEMQWIQTDRGFELRRIERGQPGA